MFAFIVRRLLYAIPVLFATSFLIFTAVSLSGDPAARVKQNPKFSQVTVAQLEHKNKLGNSLATQQPIWPDIKRVMSHTAQLILTAEIIALIVGILVGVYSAVRQ